MNLRTRALVILALPVQGGAAAAQSPPGAPAPARPAATRTVVAATKLPTVTDKPLMFRAVSITVPAGEKQNIAVADGVLYQVSGSSQVTAGSELRSLAPGEGIYIAGGTTALLQARGAEASSAIMFLLSPSGDTERPIAAAPAVVTELYRTAQPIPGLKPGTYDLNLTRVTFPAGMPSNAPHHRSGAALYYIVSGAGANTVDGKTETKGQGSWIYEPTTLVHQWGNPGEVPMTFVTFNINQEGVAAVLPDPPAKSQ